MDQCNKHFEDWTAHATVEWFLSELINKSLTNCTEEQFTLEQFTFSDDFCEGLNNVYFIDCLRHQVETGKIFHAIERHLITEENWKEFPNLYVPAIEHIAEELGTEENWKEFPNLSILLLSIARNSLGSQDQESTRSTLLDVVKQIYDRFKKKSDSCDSDSKCELCNESQSPAVKKDFCKSRYLVFRAGCQLLHFQDDENVKWDRKKFAEFVRQYSDEISKFRMLYYSTNNTTVFIRRNIERWNRINDPDEKFKYLEEYYDLNPLRFELPIQSRSSEAFKFAERFAQDFENPEKNKQTISENFVKNLAERFRIIQWEILVRNIIEEPVQNRLCFYPISEQHKISGVPGDKDFLKNFINEARKIECRFEPSHGEIPTKERYNENSLPDKKIILDKDDPRLKQVIGCHESFDMLLPEAANRYSFVHKDFVDSFANMRDSYRASNTMLIEDGELSFFSLLWLLRYARSAKKPKNSECWSSSPNDWISSPDKELTSRFRLKKSSSGSFENDWSVCNMYELAEECGLIVLLKTDSTDPSKWTCIPTRRWTSLITWLRRLNDNLITPREDDKKYLDDLVEKLKHDDSLLKRLPVKIIDYDTDSTSFIKQLWKFLASEDLQKKLNQLDGFLSGASTSDTPFAEKLGGLVEVLDKHSLLNAESKSSTGLDDTVLLRCCRGFIPLEHLIRAYKPCEFHLLFQALNWEESFHGHSKQAPISIGCATIAGRVEPEPIGESERSQDSTNGGSETDQDLPDNSKNSEVTVTDFDRWMEPYRTLFSALSTNFTLPAVKDASERKGIELGTQKQQIYFAHQTAGLLDTIWIDPKRNDLDFRSKFALWLARIHVTDIWGGFPLNTDEKIYEVDFPELKSFNQGQIFEELVKLGLRGGFLRAQKPPKSGKDDDPLWDLTEHCENLQVENPDLYDVDKLISHLCDSLSFKLPDTDPPDWVTTTVFAMCFYHGMRQAVFHALEAFILIDDKCVQKENPCLWIEWNDQHVSIYNRGRVNTKNYREPPRDRGFFERFVKLAKVFKIDGPEPSTHPADTWQLVIRKEK